MENSGAAAESARWPTRWRQLEHDPRALQRARRTRCWTQRQLAAAVGISYGYLSELESGTRNANPPLLRKLADALGCSTQSLHAPD